MKHYAVAIDTIRDEPFGIVVKNGSGSVCYGFHAAGSEWADLYNAGEIKTLEEGLPLDVELGHFGRLHFDIEDLLEKSPETIPMPEMSILVESEWLVNNSTGIGLTHVPLTDISKKSRQLAVDYKAHAFLTDSRYSSLLLKARLSGKNLIPDNSSARRTVRELLQTKMLILTQPYRHDDAISEEEMQTKALGRQIGRGARRARRIGRAAGRSAMGFDPNARDADLDMLVQEGTVYERPALPGKPNLPGAPRTARRTPADRDRSARRMRQGQGLSSSRSDAYYQPDDDPEYEKEYERQWDRFRNAMQDWTLDELTDELPQDGWSKLQDFQATLDEDELEAQLDKPIKDLPEAWQKAIRDLSEAAFNDDPDALMKMDGLRRGPGPPDPYDVAKDRRDRGLASSRSDAYYQPDDDPEFEKEFERQLERFHDAMQDYTLADLGDALPQDGNRMLEEAFDSSTDEVDAQLETPFKDLPEDWQKTIRGIVDESFNDDADSLMEMDELRGPGPPDPYDVQQDRRMEGLASVRGFSSAAETADVVQQARRRPDRRDRSTPDPMWQGPDGDPYRREQQEEVWQDQVNEIMDEQGLSEEDAIEELAANPTQGFQSFREFDRAARENAPYGSPEGDRARREDKEEYERLVQFLMDDSQERADLMARLYPERSPEDLHDYYKVLSREEAIKELQRIGNNARVLGTGPGSPLGELRKRTAEKHRSRFGAGGAGYGMRSSRRDNDSQILDASSELADAINSDDRDPDRLEHLGQKLRDGMQGSRDISAAPSKRDRTRQQYRDGLRQRTERDEMLDILNADPEERFSELRKLSEKEIVEMAKAAGIYDHRKSTAKMRRELAGLPEPVPGNIDDKFQFPEGRGGVRSAQRDPGMDINMDWDIRDPDDPRDWMESEMGPGHTAVGKISTANVNVEIVSEADIMGEGEGFMVSGFYRDIDGVRGNEAEWLYDLEVFDTPEEAAAWVDSLDESIENDVSYDDWDPPSPDSRDGLRSGRTQPSSRGGGKAGTSKKGRGPKPALNDQDYFKALKKLSPKQVRELAKEAGVDVTGMDHRQLMRNLSGSRPRPAIPGVGNSKIYVKPRSAPGQPVGGARSRMRTATTDRAATPQGLASRRRKLGYSFSRQPGSADGHIWDQLTPEQRELVAESAAERANWILRRNFGTGDPGKGGGYLTRFISDIQDGREVPARGEKKMGTTRPVGEVDVDTFRIETRRELEMFHRFINQDRGDTGNLFARQGNAQLKKQLQQSMDFITAEFNMRQGNQGAGYYEALEHFHDKDLVGAGSQVSVLQIMRRKAKERGIAEIPSNKKLLSPETYRAGPRVGADGLPVMEDGKQVVNTQPAHLSTIFGFAGGLSGESYAEEGGTTARTGRRKMRTDKEARRLADNDIFTMGARRKARRARADARRGEGQADPGTQGENPGGPTLEERIRRAKRKARIRFGKKKDVSAMNEHVKKARETIRLKRSATEKVVGAGAVEDFPEWDVTEGLPVLDEAMEVALDGIAGRHNSRRRNLKKGDEGFDPDAIVPTAKEARRTAEAAAKEQGLSAAEIKKAGDKAAAASDITNANITDHLQLVRDLYLNLGFNGSPLVVGDKEAQALLDDGWTVIQRGLTGPASDRADPAVQALARRNAIAYMDQAARHYSGGGGHGPLDDWARPYDPAIGDTDTRDGKTGSLAGNYGIGTMGFISPESKTVSHQKLIRVSDEHEAIVEALKHIRQETAEGGIKDVVDWLRKNPDASLIEELDRRQAARKIKAQVREKTRKLTGADAGTGTAKGKLDTAKGKEPMEADWKKTEMGALYHQIIKKIETAIAGGDDKTAERLGKSLKFLDDMAGEHEHMIAPILGYDVIGRHSGVTKVLNRGAIVVHETPMGMGGTRSSPTAPIFNEGDGVIQKVDELSPGHFEESIKEERAGRRFRGARAKKKKEKK